MKRDGVPVDITGWTIKFTVKETQDALDGASVFPIKTATLTDAVNGVAVIEIAADDTAGKACKTYYWDLLCVDGEAKRQNSQTGVFEILQEVTDGA